MKQKTKGKERVNAHGGVKEVQRCKRGLLEKKYYGR